MDESTARSGHHLALGGVLSCAVPDEFHTRQQCSLLELLINTLHSENALDNVPDVLIIKFDNMYEEAGCDWWVHLKLLDISAELDLAPCVRHQDSNVDAR